MKCYDPKYNINANDLGTFLSCFFQRICIKNPNSIITINESNKKYSRDQQREYVINKNKRSKEYIEKIENISYTCSNGIVSNIRNYIMKLFKIYE